MAYLRRYCGSRILEINNGQIREYCGPIKYTIDGNYLRRYCGPNEYEIEGFITNKELMALLVLLYA